MLTNRRCGGRARLLLALTVSLGAAEPSSLRSAGAAGPCARSATLDVSGRPYALFDAPGSPAGICPVHDPSIAREAGALFLFSTDAGGLQQPPFLNVRRSLDGLEWAAAGHVLDELPPWALAIVPKATNIWAPDVSFSPEGNEWRLYYAISSFGSETSVIGLATSPTLSNASWTDRGLVMRSDRGSGFNAIDANLFADAAGSWLLFGSFWSGIFMSAVDRSTGMLVNASAPPVHLAERGAPDALEGSFMVARGAFHYLFASFDYCCRGAASNYSVHVGRSSAGASGPFIDRSGVPMLSGGGTRVVGGGNGWAASGGQSLLRDTVTADGEQSVMVLHAYDGQSGDPFVNLVNLTWTADGWPELN